MMWTLDELIKDKEQDDMVNKTAVEIDNYQEEEFLSDDYNDIDEDYNPVIEESNNLVDDSNVVSINKYLIQYIRKNNRDKKGVLIAVKHDDNKIVIGWSLCSSLDVFDKYFGQEVAYERGCKRFNDDYHFEDVPHSITEHLDNFIDRCRKYFKGCDFPTWTL